MAAICAWASSNRGRGLDHRHRGSAGSHLLNRRLFAPEVEDGVEVLFDQPGGPDGLSRRQGVVDRVIGQLAPLVPCGGAAVQRGSPIRLLLEAGPQQVGKEVVVAPPAPHLVEWHQEQPGPVDVLRARPGCRRGPVTASHSGPFSRSSTDVSSRNARTSSVWRSRTSSAR